MDVAGVKVDLVARFIDQGRGPPSVVVSRHVILCLSQGRLSLFKCVFHPVSELVHCFHFGWWLVWLEAHLQVSAGVEEERGMLHGGVDMIVVGELCKGQKGVPVILSFSNEDPEELFQFLVDSLSLPVSLGVIGSG